MPHVSKHKVNNKVRQICEDELTSVLSVSSLQKEILTDTEKLMLAKRISVVYLLRIQESSYFIMNILQVSSSTVRRIRQQLYSGQYDSLIKYWDSEAKRKPTVDFIESILTIGGILPKRAFIRKKWLPYDQWLQQKRDSQNKFKK